MTTDSEYRNRMDGPMTDLSMLLYPGDTCPKGITDDLLVERAIKKINTLKRVIISAGLAEGIVNAIMEE
jgi:hypothetical protein